MDHEVPVLALRDAAGRLRAVLFGYACHATVLRDQLWSGDYPGFAQSDIEAANPGATALFVAGTGADQNALPRREVDLARAYGRRLAAAVEEVVGGPMTRIQGHLGLAYAEIDLPYARVPTREELVTEAATTSGSQAARARLLLEEIDRSGQLPRSYPHYPVHVWQLGADLTLVALGGEVVVDYALRLKRELDHPQARTWVAGYTSDVMAYIPSERVLGEGGYEGDTSTLVYGRPARWAPRIETLIVQAVHAQAGLARRRATDPAAVGVRAAPMPAP
ncbi:MAG: hypothetical protein H0V12_01115 [Chloroflexi bacterium]|nr:hypothetical protein [Chloroflexota bacterium]